MASNSFGEIFRITTWGESHGKAIGVVIDGVPSGLKLSQKEIQRELNKRKPNQNKYVSQRNENDKAIIYSGIFNGYTTGTPISIIVYNHSYDNNKYKYLKNIPRPNHADFGYYSKYNIYDYNGGGRSSGRETISRVIGGAIAKKILNKLGIYVICYTKQIGRIKSNLKCNYTYNDLIKKRNLSNILCIDDKLISKMKKEINNSLNKNDSIGGVVEGIVFGIKPGIGDPIYNKLDAELGSAILGIGGVKGFEIGYGFKSAYMNGSKYNDLFYYDNKKNKIKTKTNHCGGICGGISTGMDINFRVAIKPTPSIKKKQESINIISKKKKLISITGNHDPCIVLRIIPVIESMTYIVILNLILKNMYSNLKSIKNYYK